MIAGRAQAKISGGRLGEGGSDTPAGGGDRAGRRLKSRPAERTAADDETGPAALLAGQLQSATGGQVHVLHLPEHSGDADGSERVFHHHQGFGLVAGADLDQALGRKPQPRQPRRPQIVAPQHPDRLAPTGQRPGHQGGEGGGRGGRFGFQTCADDFMPAPERQAAAWQSRVQRCVPERQRAGLRPRAAFQRCDLRPDGAKIGHGIGTPFVPVLF